MKSYIFLLFFIFTLNLQAQEVESLISSIEQIELDNAVNKQYSALTISKGNDNVVVLEQQGINELNAYINGNNNDLFLTQVGAFNFLKTTQNGNRNLLNSTISGSYNTVTISQNGNNNVFQQDLINVNYSHLDFSQNGNNHTLIHIGKDKIAEGLEVKMTGNAMTVHIETNN